MSNFQAQRKKIASDFSGSASLLGEKKKKERQEKNKTKQAKKKEESKRLLGSTRKSPRRKCSLQEPKEAAFFPISVKVSSVFFFFSKFDQ